MKESKFSRFQANVIVTKQKLLNSILGRDQVHMWSPFWAVGEEDRRPLVTNVEVLEEEIIKVLGEECRERGIWGEKRRKGVVKERRERLGQYSIYRRTKAQRRIAVE